MSESTAKPTTSQPQRKSPRLLAQLEESAGDVAKRQSKSPIAEPHETAGAPARIKLKAKRQSKSSHTSAGPIVSESETATEAQPASATPKANESESASASKPISHESCGRRKMQRASRQRAGAGAAAKPETRSKSILSKGGTAEAARSAPNKGAGGSSQKATEPKSDTEPERQPDAAVTIGRNKRGRPVRKQTREVGTSVASKPETAIAELAAQPKRESLRAKASGRKRPHAKHTPQEHEDINQFRCITNF